jgi:hypothetical protein
VERGFDPPATPYGPGHRGVDLAAAPGTAVLAAGPGVVAYAGLLAGRGVVSIQHANGLRTTYEPVAATVHAGAVVAAAAVIGHLVAGHPGCARTACLHWGLRRGDTYLDPLLLLRAGPVRLLPRTGLGGAAATGSATTPYPTGSDSGPPGATGAGPPTAAASAGRTGAGHPTIAGPAPITAATLTVALGWLAFRRRGP